MTDTNEPAKVQAIAKQGLTPTVVLESAAKDLPDMADVFIVSFTKDGSRNVYASGNLARLGLAIVVLQDIALAELNGTLK